MATGLAIGVTVVGVAAIVALLGLLARQYGLWAWTVNWLRATKEEKTKLCRQERNSSGRSYMDTNNGFEDHHRREHRFFYKLDNDLDWINLWPRSGSYKRFSNLDDVNADDPQMLRMGGGGPPHDPSIPPQPLRPAPGPPHRISGRDDEDVGSPFSFPGAGMMMGMMMRSHGGGLFPSSRHSGGGSSDFGRPIPMPMIDRRDSSRSMNTRIRTSSAQDYSPEILPSTNPFRSSSAVAEHSMYSHLYPNPFASTYGYEERPHSYQRIEEENRLNQGIIHERPRRSYPSNIGRSDHMYSPKNYEDYSRISPLHVQTLDMNRDRIIEDRPPPKYGAYTPEIGPSSSQIAYSHSLNQALLKQRSIIPNSIHSHRYINRYDKIKQDEERIREEERILNQLRYENDLMRRESFKKSLQSNSPFGISSLNSNLYDINETRELEREAMRENLAYDFQRGASDLREELQKRMLFEIRPFSSQESRDSPPPPAPDITPNLSYSDSADSSPKEKYIDWRDRINRRNAAESKDPLDVPTTPPNTASLTPPNSVSAHQNELRKSSLIDPYTSSLLQERLAEIEELRYKETKADAHHADLKDEKEVQEENNYPQYSENINGDAVDSGYHDVYSAERDEIGGELTHRLHALQEGKGPDIYPKALKERIEKRREREGSRRKRKRERDLERRNSFRQSMENSLAKERSDPENLSNASQGTQSLENISQISDINISVTTSDSGDRVNCEQTQDSAFTAVPFSVEKETKPTVDSSSEQITLGDEISLENEEPTNLLTVANLSSRNLGDSPVVPRKSFLSYKGSWTLGSNGNDENEVVEQQEDDANTKRVREYIASLSARLQQLPDKNEEQSMEAEPIHSPPRSTPPSEIIPPSTVSFPVTPPNSAARTNSQSSSDTPSSTAANWGSVHGWRAGSTETPPNSAGVQGPSQRPSYSDTPPSSASYYAPTPPNSASSNFSDTPPQSAGYGATPPNSGSLNGSFDLGTGTPGTPLLKRAMSCDSVSSDTSVTLGELEDESGQITGYLSIQVLYECDTQDLEVVVLEARDLIGPDQNVPLDSYVRVFLLPDKSTNMQTRVAKRSNSPSYRERFLFALEEEEALDRSLSFYMYATDKFTNTMIGEAQVKLGDLDLNSSQPVELTLTDSGQKGIGYGEIMFSLSYLPTAERLTVVIVKARNLQFSENRTSADPFVKVYILQNGKKKMKKKTTIKRGTDSPVFNEAMIFSVPAPSLHNIQLRLTVAEFPGENSMPVPIGHVIVGTQATGKALSHWNQMMSSLRKPIGMWHALRR